MNTTHPFSIAVVGRIAVSIAVAVPMALAGLEVAPPAHADESPPALGSTVTVPLTGVETEPAVEAAAPHAGRTAVLTTERATAAYSLLGVTWADPGAGARVAVHVRTRTAGVWSRWHELHADGESLGRGRQSEREGTEPFWAGGSDGVQVRVGVLIGDTPRDLRLELIDPGASAVDHRPPTPPKPNPPSGPGRDVRGRAARPAIVARKDWGADESIRDKSFKYTSTIKAVFVHHTADGNDFACADSAKVVRAIYRYHVVTNGWADIGYNFLVDKCGTIFEGRAGGVDKAVLGAHTLGFNTNSTGVAALGTYTTTKPQAPVLTAIEKVIAWKLGLHGRNPRGKVTLTSSDSGSRYAKGSTHAFDVISGHRDAFNTECPGQALYDKLPEIRAAVARSGG
ncbi:peptidoglycan recognition protein [Streptomyces sp. SID3343]|uniref:peptidoglycan recognition protein family protein n=1 Tax=Streptomyces sp. SID3343 TaxID=2690260 RepID=UPI001369AC06|nr:peptidoglycan recognition protein [Streptomyces sp. SID3343]MYW00053.1 N-acetylmuramoyl-L-alanine amidase [Streptomyces sp. SID3343]